MCALSMSKWRYGYSRDTNMIILHQTDLCKQQKRYSKRFWEGGHSPPLARVLPPLGICLPNMYTTKTLYFAPLKSFKFKFWSPLTNVLNEGLGWDEKIEVIKLFLGHYYYCNPKRPMSSYIKNYSLFPVVDLGGSRWSWHTLPLNCTHPHGNDCLMAKKQASTLKLLPALIMFLIREYGSTLYVGMARKKNGRPYNSIANGKL